MLRHYLPQVHMHYGLVGNGLQTQFFVLFKLNVIITMVWSCEKTIRCVTTVKWCREGKQSTKRGREPICNPRQTILNTSSFQIMLTFIF